MAFCREPAGGGINWLQHPLSNPGNLLLLRGDPLYEYYLLVNADKPVLSNSHGLGKLQRGRGPQLRRGNSL